MTVETVDTRVRTFLASHCSALSGADLDEQASDAFNQTELRVPELEMVTLIVAIEDEFGIKISDDQAKGLMTVADAIHLVRGLTEAKVAEEVQRSSAAA